ncbi:hypothetical protein V8G54_023414 [Vigna mungo]|uniref:F-box domain-containing protein n=1 Tax=Vigna mungo TaxID=3915 RepID=A0AAQ3N5D1_VIGMU
MKELSSDTEKKKPSSECTIQRFSAFRWKKNKRHKKLRMKSKRATESGEREEREDILSDLPDEVLQHIMEFLPTIQAIQTCVLSKRWKNLWRCLTTLTFEFFNGGIHKYNRYVNHVLSNRDDSISLHKMCLTVFNSTTPKVLNNAIKYASEHHIHELTLFMDIKFKQTPKSFIPLVINCKSLTLLVIYSNSSSLPLILPPSFAIPSLKTLFLYNVVFTARDDNSCAEPFSECTSLIALHLEGSMLTHSTKTLCISNPSLYVLNMKNIIYWHFEPKTVLHVPKLQSITLEDNYFSTYYKLSCTCDLPLLTEVKISTRVYIDPSRILHWLRIFSNVRTLTICSHILNMLKDICPDTLEIQPPRFARFESLKIKMHSGRMMSKTELNMVVNYLWNCQTTNVKVTECSKL